MKLSYDVTANKLVELEKKCFPSSAYTLEQLEEILIDKERYITIVVLDNEKEVGYIILFDNSEALEIMKIGTIPEFKRRGIGTLLIEESLKLKKDIFLEVRENNSVAREFYKKLLFTEIGKRKNYYSDTNEAAIIMLRKI